MKTYSLAIAWNWEFDDDFIAGIERECRKRDLSTYRIDPHNLNDTMEKLRSGAISFQAFYDRASDADSLFLPLVQIMLESSIYFINPRSRVLPAIDKATMHLEFITHGLQVPYTIILPPFHERREITLQSPELEHLGRPFVIKPANTTGGGTGVVLDAGTVDDVLEARQLHKNDKYLLQQFIVPKQLDGKRGWFRVYRAFGEVIPCWWDDQTHRYTELTAGEERLFRLEELRRVMGTIESVCRLDFFSSEIAVTREEKFVVVDYVNEVCDMRLQSKYANGAPDAVVHRIENLLAEEVALRVKQFVYVT
ncbi:MAG TPA: hypothetical protein VI215_08630 [Bacteroidota bacterium]